MCQRRTWKSHDHITTAALLGIAGVRLSAYSGCRACFQLAIQYYGVYNDSANLKQIPIMTKKKKKCSSHVAGCITNREEKARENGF